MDARRLTQDELYARAAADFGPALGRLARAYERDPDRQRDLQQDIHFALWRSFETYEGRSSMRTWVYRVATTPQPATSSGTSEPASRTGSISSTSPTRPIPTPPQKPLTTPTSSPA